MSRTTITAGIVLVAILGALTGWYVFLRSRTTAIEKADADRGIGIPTPFSASGALGGTTANISSSSYAPASGLGPLAGVIGAAGGSAQNWTATSTRDGLFSDSLASTTEGTPFKVRFTHTAKTPVSGFAFISRGTATRLVWADRATGHIFAVDLDRGDTVRLTNTLRPKIYEAIFDDHGVIERGVTDDGSVETFLGAFDDSASSTPGALSGFLIENGIRAVATAHSAQSSLLYIRTGKDGGSEAVFATRSGSKGKVIFSSPIPGWRPYALADGRIIVAQLPATGSPGFAYEIGKGNALSPITPSAPGLIILPRAWSSALLWSRSDANGTALFARASEEAETARLSLATPADKCAWAVPSGASAKKPGILIAYCAVPKDPPAADFLEARYQGVLHTEDRWWKVDAASGSIEPLYSGSEIFDVRDPAIDPSGRFLAFINAADDSLWLMQIAQ